jgi:pyruvate dehydrogenase kinase 2/3/4
MSHARCRLAHRIREFQNLPFIIGTNPHIHAVYELYWDAFEKLRAVPALHSLEDNEAFCALVKKMLAEHLVVIPQLAWGMAQSYSLMPESDSDRFMTETLKSRIGRRVLAEQHLALSESWEAHHGDHDLGRWIGIIDTACQSDKLVRKCTQKAAMYIQEATGMRPPDVHINGHLDAEFLYIPEHVEYILFELIKNSMQATLRKHGRAETMPPILVTVGQHKTSVIFRVSDQGGGIDVAIQKSIFSFAQGARRNLDNFAQIPKMAAKMNEPRPHYSLGLSLAMSRIYSK